MKRNVVIGFVSTILLVAAVVLIPLYLVRSGAEVGMAAAVSPQGTATPVSPAGAPTPVPPPEGAAGQVSPQGTVTPVSQARLPIQVPPPEGAATARELSSVGILFSPLPEVGLAVSREQAIETVLTHQFERPQLKGARPRPRIYQSVGAQYGIGSEPGQNLGDRKVWLVTVVGMPPVRPGWTQPGQGEPLYSIVISLVDAATGEELSGGILTHSEGDAPR